MYPHRIHLRGPWVCEPLAEAGGPPLLTQLAGPTVVRWPLRRADLGWPGFRGRVRLRRRFGYPGRIDAWERVWLTVQGGTAEVSVSLGGAAVGERRGPGGAEWDVTALLGPRNEVSLVADLGAGDGVVEGAGEDGAGEGGGVLWADVALEVRAKAYLRDVRVSLAGDEVVATGAVLGEADGPLDLYLLVDDRNRAYQALRHIPRDGHTFRLADPATGREAGAGWKVDLVNGAVVWYTATGRVETPGREPRRCETPGVDTPGSPDAKGEPGA